ncbi:MAG TPA: class I SAM-dependent methyltransferase [Thermoanaerobaculia bacterium]|nr:class I SAM-dependent methyltransferase [Thermoanaerobaculia bacterium]
MTDPLRAVADYYAEKLRANGPGAAGVDWNSAESQALRFRELSRLLPAEGSFSVLDVGCGTGALVDFLAAEGWRFSYWGCDVSDAMLQVARRLHAGRPDVRFAARAEDAPPCDFAFASGIFNVKLDADDDAWSRHMEATVRLMARQGLRGIAFNALSVYSDPGKRRADLHYADPLKWFDFCKREISTSVALLHDYPLWEFTLLVRR